MISLRESPLPRVHPRRRSPHRIARSGWAVQEESFPSRIRRQKNVAEPTGKNLNEISTYYSWFNGCRLLDRPMEMLLQAPEIDLPFCLMWANENWSRRWDGGDSDVLISQDYRAEDDEALIADFGRHMRDPRYIRIGERPLFMLYRPGAIPDAARRIAKWRALFREQEYIDPIFIMAQAFDDNDPRPFGMDGAIEFPPHKLSVSCTPIEDKVQILDEDMTARIYDYGELVENALADPAPDFPLIRTLAPSWDNDPRRQGAGLVLHGSTPRLYEHWLKESISKALQNPFMGEPFLCINAWNEWAEGAYLEPDIHFGSAYLNATARAVTGFQSRLGAHRLLLIGHDAFPAGAQMLLLALGTALKRHHGIEITFVLLGGGDLLSRYRQVANVEILNPGTSSCIERLQSLKAEGFASAIMNSAVSARLAPDLGHAELPFILLIHELPGMLRQHRLEEALTLARKQARAVIVPGAQLTRLCPEAIIAPQGLYNQIAFSGNDRKRARLAYGIDPDALLVIGIGYGDARKGFDLFLQLWQMLQSSSFTGSEYHAAPDQKPRPLHFLWVGNLDEQMKRSLQTDIEGALTTRRFHLPGRVEDVNPFLSASDLFLLMSREDPYPSVALEALASGLPCVAFARNGMIPDLLSELEQEGDTRNHIIEPGDLPAIGAVILRQTHDRSNSLAYRIKRGAELAERFAFGPYVARLAALAMPDLPSISVVVLSYNYAHYLAARLATIFAQDCPITEIIVLDDASNDGSAELSERIAASFGRTIKLVAGTRRSGSVFAQWRKAVDLATGDWIWIAEADDLSEPGFLSALSNMISQSPDAVMAFCDSRVIDETGAEISADYQTYYRSHVGHRLERNMLIDGESFTREYLGKCNLVLNVSSALFRRRALSAAMESCRADLAQIRLAGDWRLYIELLMRPGSQVAYLAEPLNIHRRHDRSVTGSLDQKSHLGEIAMMHDLISKRLGRPLDLMRDQRSYRELLKKQFGLTTRPRKKQYPAP
ncbi:glycoside hydrolase family 99-like domain-containing protein [Asaia spathodeae]|uniref:Glycoside hydrolase family 99-like domain-containing protein n=1 Tax=Asaia spathodeae TaxID=657016 RepID=A0ABX2P7C5_9PROT|nr:glycoside hydrolase family 99-like domain-containing protein [Asaia spathodeae]